MVPVEVKGVVATRGYIHDTGFITPPGVVPSAAYAAGDALGRRFAIELPYRRGVVYSAVCMDRDKEALGVDLELFAAPFADTADNSAFTISDDDHLQHLGTIRFGAADFISYNAEASATLRNYGLGIVAPQRCLWVQATAQGAQSLTSALDYAFRIVFLMDPE